MTTSFRQTTWVCYFDFESLTGGTSVVNFLALGDAERAAIARNLTPEAEFFDVLDYSIKSHLFWEMLDLKYKD